mmetsp:Transcript_21375/g.46933  ORF Transcript_21375/g.46933 Transcript_21375/m.46933 type:complete len:251 (+) Transcript_21375:133-885(+)
MIWAGLPSSWSSSWSPSSSPSPSASSSSKSRWGSEGSTVTLSPRVEPGVQGRDVRGDCGTRACRSLGFPGDAGNIALSPSFFGPVGSVVFDCSAAAPLSHADPFCSMSLIVGPSPCRRICRPLAMLSFKWFVPSSCACSDGGSWCFSVPWAVLNSWPLATMVAGSTVVCFGRQVRHRSLGFKPWESAAFRRSGDKISHFSRTSLICSRSVALLFATSSSCLAIISKACSTLPDSALSATSAFVTLVLMSP